ncbi:hypothetical protein [Hydrogenimonas sp.]
MKKALLLLSLTALWLQTETLSLQSCLDKALANHPDVKAYLYNAPKNPDNKFSIELSVR